jgi:HD superfamily phosphodiesterase
MGHAPLADDAGAWAGRAADVPAGWFTRDSWLHGVRHAQRVHVHARRLVRALRWPEADANVALSAALWHDIGRVNDAWDSRHGALSAARVVELGLHESLAEADARLALFAVRYHCRSDGHGALRAAGQDDPERALRILWLLKDADALDRVRLGDGACEVDSTALRHHFTPGMIDFAEELLSVMP